MITISIKKFKEGGKKKKPYELVNEVGERLREACENYLGDFDGNFYDFYELSTSKPFMVIKKKKDNKVMKFNYKVINKK
uniref:Uncharacterized protein n=1 Tax=viral metagenome TaxID=1070528 RepID=A0A6M3LLF0_9ZZZZ